MKKLIRLLFGKTTYIYKEVSTNENSLNDVENLVNYYASVGVRISTCTVGREKFCFWFVGKMTGIEWIDDFGSKWK